MLERYMLQCGRFTHSRKRTIPIHLRGHQHMTLCNQCCVRLCRPRSIRLLTSNGISCSANFQVGRNPMVCVGKSMTLAAATPENDT